MYEFKVSFSNKQFNRKPNNKEAALLSEAIANNSITVNQKNIKEFATLVGSKGCAFCPATFINGKRRKENYEQMQLLALDFDNKDSDKTISVESAKDRANYYDLPVLFAYDTFTSQNHNKFRLIFLNDNPVSDIRTAETMLKALTTIFPEADRQSRSAAQMYYGGKNLLFYDDTVPTINIESVIRNTVNYLEDRFGATHYKRKIAEFSRDTGIALNKNGLLDISVVDESAEETGAADDGKNLSKLVYIDGFDRKLPKLKYRINYEENGTKNLSDEKYKNYNRPHRSDLLCKISPVCQLFCELENGDRRLSHQELFGIATNIIQIAKGEYRFKELLQKYSYYDNRSGKYQKWVQDLRRIKGYKPFSCDGFCPYHNTCPHGKNILSTVKPLTHQMERIANYDERYASLYEASRDFKRNFLHAVKSSRKGWHIIKAQTALGKTQAILELLCTTALRILIAVPTNKLKREIYERAKKMGVSLTVSPSLHELKADLPSDIWNDIDDLYESGKPTMPYINKLINEADPDYSYELMKYKNDQNDFKESTGHAITTHRRLLTLDTSEYDAVIIDEDIIFNTVIPNKSDLNVSNLKKLKKEVSPATPLARKIRKVLKEIEDNEFFMLKEIPYSEDYADISMAVDIPALCSASHFCYRMNEDCVSFLRPIKFSDNSKFVMVSATVEEKICEYYFGDNMIFYECANARNAGELDQYYSRSLSRADIDKDPTIIKQLTEFFGFDHTISFKKYMTAGLYKGDLHFGNCAGCDYMKGKNIHVIGTPHQPEWIYKLFAFSLPSLDFNINAKLKSGTIAEHNGWRFRFMTYEDEALRAIQFYMIESQLEQAVGRARLLRETCKVSLFSNFPLRQAHMKELNFDKQ